MSRCQRFHTDGSPCSNQTNNADGWCRQDGCGGYQRANTAAAPEGLETADGSSPQNETPGVRRPLVDITAVDLVEVRLTTRAVDSFRFHHGGGVPSAETQLRAMLEDFLLKSVQARTESGYLKLFRKGFTLVMSPGLDAITGYSSLHRERTWEQVKAGVASRIRHENSVSPRVDES